MELVKLIAGNIVNRIIAITYRLTKISYLSRVSERQISIYKATDLSAPINTVGLDVSPAILIPFYDEDSSTLFLTGKVRN